MGTDIHLWVEILKEDRWMFAHPHYFDSGDGAVETYDPEVTWVEWEQPYRVRNYALFALLANVRNHDNRFTPLSFPRGVPGDLSDIGRLIARDGEEGLYHTFSWLTLEELLDHDWDAPCSMESGYVPADEVDDFVRHGHAPSPLKSSAVGRHTVRVERPLTFAEMAGAFHDELLPLLKSLGEPDRVRIVFCFDS